MVLLDLFGGEGVILVLVFIVTLGMAVLQRELEMEAVQDAMRSG